MAGGAPRGRLRRVGGRGGPGSEHEGGGAAGVGAGARGRRVDRARLGVSEGGYGNRRRALTQQVVWAEEYARARAPGAGRAHRGEPARAHADRVRGRGAAAAVPAGHRPGRGAVVPGLQRAGRRVRPRRGADGGGPGRCRRIASAGRRSGRRWPRRPTGASCWRGRIRRRGGTAGCRSCWCRWTSRGVSRCGRSGRCRGRRVQRGVLRRRGARGACGRAARARAGGWPWGCSRVERGVSTLVQQIGFAAELDEVVAGRGALRCAAAIRSLRDRLVRQWAELRVMRWNALRTLGAAGDAGRPECGQAAVGRLASAARGAGDAGAGRARRRSGPATGRPQAPYELDALQRLFLFTRADTIYGGSDEIQRNIIAERVLGLPRVERTMRGVIFDGKQPQVVDDLEVRDPGPGEVLVGDPRPPGCATAICRWSTGPFRSRCRWCWGMRARGWWRRWARASRMSAPGDHVALSTLANCGACAECDRGRPTMCRKAIGMPQTAVLGGAAAGCSSSPPTRRSRNGRSSRPCRR